MDEGKKMLVLRFIYHIPFNAKKPVAVYEKNIYRWRIRWELTYLNEHQWGKIDATRGGGLCSTVDENNVGGGGATTAPGWLFQFIHINIKMNLFNIMYTNPNANGCDGWTTSKRMYKRKIFSFHIRHSSKIERERDGRGASMARPWPGPWYVC